MGDDVARLHVRLCRHDEPVVGLSHMLERIHQRSQLSPVACPRRRV